MQTLMMQVVKSDPINRRGLRRAEYGDLSLLHSFDCNTDAPLRDVLAVDVSAQYDRATGIVEIDLPSFIPHAALRYPDHANNFRIVCEAAALDFKDEVFNGVHTESASLPLNNLPTAPLHLQLSLAPNETRPVIVALTVQYREVVNGFEYAIINNTDCALNFVLVDNV